MKPQHLLINKKYSFNSIMQILLLMISSLFIMQNVYAVQHITLFDDVSGAYTAISKQTETTYVARITNAPTVNPNDTQYLKIEIPPGTVQMGIQMFGNSTSAVVVKKLPAVDVGTTPSIDNIAITGSYTSEGGAIYNNVNAMIQGDNATYAYLVTKSNGSSFAYTTIILQIILANTDEAKSLFSAWLTSHGGTTGGSTTQPANDPVDTTPVNNSAPDTNDYGDSFGSGSSTTSSNNAQSGGSSGSTSSSGSNPLLALLLGGGGSKTTTTATTTETGGFDQQTFKTGDEAIVERLIVLGFVNAGVDGLTKVENFKHKNGVFTIDFGDGSSMRFFINVHDLPVSLDNLDKDSVKFVARKPKGIEKGGSLAMTFKVGSSDYDIGLNPSTHEEGLLSEILEGYEGIFKVIHSDDGWLVILLDNGTSFSLYFDFMHKAVSTQKGNDIVFEQPIEHGYDDNDVNGDGMTDVIMIYNGIAQLLLFKPI